MPPPESPSACAPDERGLDHLAAPRSGIVTRQALLAAGWSASAVDRAVRRGRLHRLAPGVFRVDGAPFSRAAARHAALAIAGDGALIAGWSAAELHGFAEDRAGPVEVLVRHGTSVPERGPLLHATRTRTLVPEDRSEVDGLRVTAPARTLLDLAARRSTDRLGELVAAALREASCTTTDLAATLAAHPRARGRGRLRAALALLADDGASSRSDVEVGALQALVDGGLPRPVLAHRVRDTSGAVIAEVDLAYPDQHLAIEIDGYRWHSSPARKRADEERQNRLVLAGWTVLRFSASEVRSDPGRLVAAVRTALGAADVTP
jgi:hypothetical protein